MAIPRFDKVFSEAVEAMQAAADRLRYLRDSQGDLQRGVIFDMIPADLARAKAAAVAAIREIQLAPATAGAALTRYPGAPQTVAAFLSAVGAVEAAAQGWNADLASWLDGLAVADLVALQGVDLGSGVVGQFVWMQGLSEAKVEPLRGSAGLAVLIGAFEAAGATA